MSEYNNTLYNASLYNNVATSINEKYNNTKNGVDFWNNFKIPNSFSNICMIWYLDPLNASYSTNRLTQVEQRFTNIQKTQGGIEIKGRIFGKSRKDLVKNIEYFKKQVEGEREIIFKDDGVERGAKVYNKIQFSENHFNITFIDFSITATFLDYIYHSKSISLNNKNLTQQEEIIDFYNRGEETHFIGVLEYFQITANSTVNIEVNGIPLQITAVNSGDTIIIDTYEQDIKINWLSFVFWGIISKLKLENNIIKVSDTGSTRNFNFKIVYKKTII